MSCQETKALCLSALHFSAVVLSYCPHLFSGTYITWHKSLLAMSTSVTSTSKHSCFGTPCNTRTAAGGPPGRCEVKPTLTLGITQLVCSLIANEDRVVQAYCMPLQVRQQQEQCTALHQAAAQRLQHWRKLLQATQGAVDVAVSVQLVIPNLLPVCKVLCYHRCHCNVLAQHTPFRAI